MFVYATKHNTACQLRACINKQKMTFNRHHIGEYEMMSTFLPKLFLYNDANRQDICSQLLLRCKKQD